MKAAGWQRKPGSLTDDDGHVGVAGLGAQLFQHATSRLKCHDVAPTQGERNGHATSARANVQNVKARPKPGSPPELVEILIGQGGAVPTIETLALAEKSTRSGTASFFRILVLMMLPNGSTFSRKPRGKPLQVQITVARGLTAATRRNLPSASGRCSIPSTPSNVARHRLSRIW